ncbi:conserved Plasmodium protein, unknown function [Plasmodium knowlesi strain H]|uniref:SprT-like domain-containing protein n=3 Tax=Plasmodium knowlesi TaxID=5850 RepID=A0A5K1UJW2_PLAKH|nr:SprT-like domain-containing protein, putative [Plasmodium knowlesi strain H]OTN66337.1 Uncharacterized protein PKNOH_S09536000 [Plasmodium knowlesi]CAA9989949.1 SprT-like domain-containing protein, putative [Plasmodium knowlesi strain H]SBO24528.1 conserved Plasmodium protein, unknown function [Plasmodium knowlesi strain H]SBO26407.1 conserved Plasmodium protein, unknown function [Plasmodium knowlesi strain H]VVS79423.1 SprT-like domain-containing protein, putative [Plasmodium knowlesi stra|eukprot:XP_002259964.1 hypothetical protein, conserved in Plasmodium species [Plasmodium knowlesi strain H]
MNDGLNKLTSVESEYLEKSGKKRRQKSLTLNDDVSTQQDANFERICLSTLQGEIEQNKEIALPDIYVSDRKTGQGVHPSCVNLSESYPLDAEVEEEDFETLEVIKQLSSIRIDSDTDNSVGGDKVVCNKKENTPKKRNKKKRGKHTITPLWDNTDVECVEDAIIYDESKDTDFPDLLQLFEEYNEKYFFNKLKSVQVKWSNKMKLCAGICIFKKSGYCCIRLSLPLLKLRKIKEYRETLLHEMIHAFLFLTRSNSRHDGHGPEFKKHMYRINKATGLCITIYHSFHKEVNFYRNHVWRCTGVCRTYPPHFGYVKRSMNRPPGPKEKWWRRHSSYCRGNFIKMEKGKEDKNSDTVHFGATGYNSGILGKAMESTRVKNKKTSGKDGFEKRADTVNTELLNDAIVILDSKKQIMEKQKEVDEMDIINLIKTLFSDNKQKVWSFPDLSVDYHKAFKNENYFEID